MRKTLSALLYLSLFLLATADGVAQPAQRTFVSAGTGNDSNPCTRQQPCRNFASAIAATAVGGEVIVLDSGGYGTVLITGSISLTSPPGVYAGITAFSGSAISVAISDSEEVTLRGLTLQGLGGNFGISYSSGGYLAVESCAASNFAAPGIYLSHAADGGRMLVANSVVRNGLDGINIRTSSGQVHVVIDHVRVENNNYISGFGFYLQDGARVLMTDSTSAHHHRQIYVIAGAVVDIQRCQFFGDRGTSVGLTTTTGGTIRILNSVISNNGTGVSQGASSPIYSGGNNFLESNTAGNVFTSAFTPK
jgi:parallel beta helix pectate lyase-like protein